MDKEEAFHFIQIARIRLDRLEEALRNLWAEDSSMDIRLAVVDAITPLKLIAEDIGLTVEVDHG